MGRTRMTPELKPLFGSADRRRADRPADLKDYLCIAASAVSGLLLWGWGDGLLGMLLIGLALHWGTAKWPERQADLMDYVWIALPAVGGLALWSRGRWVLAVASICLALHWGFAKMRELRFKRS